MKELDIVHLTKEFRGLPSGTEGTIVLEYDGRYYLLYRTNAITFDMNTIIMMFGFGMVVHFAISLFEEKVILDMHNLVHNVHS